VSESLLHVLNYFLLAAIYLFLFVVTRVAVRELKPQPVVIVGAPHESKRRSTTPERTKTTGPGLLGLSPESIAGERFEIDQESTLGRAPGCTIVLTHDTFISQVHVRFTRQNKNLFIEDLKSTNGTLVNNKKIDSLTRLKKGDRITIGRSVFEVVK
jgi:pSer/pThr/pTyr-binding forkhead associated (FHA) protein